jgi:tetratricopeptide (TPR) repeat protein
MLCHFGGKYSQALNFLEESIQISREIKEWRVLPTALHVASIASLAVNRGDRALTYCDEAIEVALAQGYNHAHAGALNTRGQVLRFIQHLDAARHPLNAAFNQLESLGDKQGATNSLLNLAMIDIELGQLESARQSLVRIIERCKQLNSPILTQGLLDACGALLVSRGCVVLGAQLIHESNRLGGETASRRDAADQRFIDRILVSAIGIDVSPIDLRSDQLFTKLQALITQTTC